jgi:hypothetical protein
VRVYHLAFSYTCSSCGAATCHSVTERRYPGPGGKPLGSIRLSNIADGIEVRLDTCCRACMSPSMLSPQKTHVVRSALQDWELFNKLGANSASISNAADLISQLVTNETMRHEDPSLLEKLRREAAHRVMAAERAVVGA